MAFSVKFNFVDEFGGQKSRTWHNTSATLADALTDVGTFATSLDLISTVGLVDVVISQRDTGAANPAESPSNIDENASVQILGDDGYKYDINIPCPNAALRLANHTIDTSDLDFVAFMAQFEAGGKWRVNLRNPVVSTGVVKATLDT